MRPRDLQIAVQMHQLRRGSSGEQRACLSAEPCTYALLRKESVRMFVRSAAAREANVRGKYNMWKGTMTLRSIIEF